MGGQQAPAATTQSLWTSGAADFPCYRQPAIAPIPGTATLLAFVEGRFSAPCAPPLGEAELPYEVGGMNLRVSTDHGDSWGPSRVIYGNATKQGPNMDYFSAVAIGKDVHLFLAVKGIQHFVSADAGATWAGPTPLQLPEGGAVPHAPTCGHGVVLSNGDVVVPAVCNGSCALISSDKGHSWRVGGFGVKGSRESSIAEVPCASADTPGPCLYMNARNMNKPASAGQPHTRFQAWSSTGGLSWSTMTASTLTTPVTPHWTGIVANVVRLGPAATATAAPLVYAGASSPTARAAMALSVNADGTGKSWGAKQMVWPGPAGYADIVALNATHVGVLYEAGDKTFADRIQFSVVRV